MPGVTLKDIAAACGLDISTVSRALRDDPRVKPPTRERVQTAALELGYRPHLAARSLAAGRTEALWLIAPDVTAPHLHGLVEAATRQAQLRGYDLVISLYGDDPATCRRQVARLGQGVADGAILIPTFASTTVPQVQQLIRAGFPLVLLDRNLADLDVPAISTDHTRASQTLTEGLLADGAEAIINLMAPANSALAARIAGVRAACQQAGIPCLQAGDKLPAGTLGVVANDQQTALAWCRQLRRASAPLAAVFDRWIGTAAPCGVVHVCRQDLVGMAQQAIRHLVDRIAGHPSGRPIRLPAAGYDRIL